MSLKAIVARGWPVLLYVLHMLTSLRPCRYRTWQANGAPTPFLPRWLKDTAKRIERAKRQQVGKETVVHSYGAKRSQPCRRFASYPVSKIHAGLRF